MIRTINTVEINSGLIGTKPVILYGKINESLWHNDFESLKVIGEYFYFEEDEKILVKHFEKNLTKPEINGLYALVEVNEELKTENEKKSFDLGFRLLMAQEYSINLENIEIHYGE